MRREIIWALLLAPFIRVFLIDLYSVLREQVRRHRRAKSNP